MASTDYFEQLVLGHALLQNPYSIQDWYLGLWIASPTSAGLLSGEVAAADYQRKPVSWAADFTNSAIINWAAATSNWGTVDYVALTNSPNKGSGNVLLYESTTSSFTVEIGRPLTIPAGGLVLIAP